MVVGILALQGGVIEHARMVESLGATTRLIKRPSDFDGIDALILPGGESTTLNKLLGIFDLRDPLIETARRVPTLGTCAGLILLSQLGIFDVEVKRNAFGPQVDSTEATLPWRDSEVRAAFIRAPEVTDPRDAEVLSRFDGRIVAVAKDNLIGISFHPELTGDATVHEELLSLTLTK